MKLKDITASLEELAPLDLAEPWDNVGLLAGDYDRPVRTVLLTIDLTSAVFAEAVSKKVELIVSYHPPIFEPIERLVAGCGAKPFLYEALRRGMAIYSPHTALDAVKGGVNDCLAEIVGISDPSPISRAATVVDKFYKFVVFVPASDLEKVSEAVFSAGAGRIGGAGKHKHEHKYTKCSFRSEGTGTFQCGEQSNPTIGRPGSFEQVAELRLETIVPADSLTAVTKAMLSAHSYEEPAFDIVPLAEPGVSTGMGRFGDLESPQSVDELVSRIKKSLKIDLVGLIGNRRGRLRRAAVCAGSGGTIFREAIRHGCDFYLTGELKHHHALELQESSVTAVCLGHSVSERFMLQKLARRLSGRCGGIKFVVSRKDRDPFTWR